MSLGICAVLRNEEKYLDEWISFHVKQGVTLFVLYENDSTDDTYKVLQRLQKEYTPKNVGISIHTIKGNPSQRAAYARGVNLLKNLPNLLETPKWVAFIDADEFLYSPGVRNLPDILKNYEKYNAVAVNWYIYGSNGHLSYSPEPMTERFTRRSKELNQHTKAIVQIKNVLEVGRNPHYFMVRGPTVDENGNVLRKFLGLNPNGTAEILRINHYYNKSLEEYEEKMKIPRADSGMYRTMEGFHAHDCNEVEDRSACGLFYIKNNI